MLIQSNESEESEVKIMEEYIEVRRLKHQEGLSVRQISRQTGIHRKTIDKILEFGAPPGIANRAPPYTDAFSRRPASCCTLQGRDCGSNFSPEHSQIIHM